MNWTTAFSSLALAVFSFGGAQAALADSLRTYRIMPARVASGGLRRAALSRTELDSALLAQQTGGSLADLLAAHSAVYVKSYGLGSAAAVSLRGTAASHTRVEWNGVPINDPMLGQVDFSLLPVGFVDQAELLYGGSSLLGGSGALGGTVALGSLPRWNDRLYGAAMQGVGSFGSRQTHATVGGGGRRIHARVRYFYEQARNDFEFLNTAIPPFETAVQQNADYRKQGALSELYVDAAGGHFLSLHAWYQTVERNLPPIMSYQGTGRTENERDRALRGALKWSKYGTGYKSELIGGFSATRLDYLQAHQTDWGVFTPIDSRSQTRSYTLRYTLEYELRERTLLRGLLDGGYHTVRSHNAYNGEGYDAHRAEAGLSLSVHQRLSGVFSGYALLRGDWDDDRGDDRKISPLMPALGIEAAVGSRRNVRLRLSAARNYHRPTLNDLYWIPGGNPALKPERGYTLDGGVRWEWPGDAGQESAQGRRFALVAEAVGFASWIDDWIVWRPGDFRYWTAENLRRVFSRGAELSLRASYTPAAELKFTARAHYAYTRTTNERPTSAVDASAGRQLIYIPQHKASAMLEAVYRAFRLSYTWNYTGERYTTSSNEPVRFGLPGYWLHDLTLGASKTLWKLRGELQFKVDNLLNKQYQAILWRAMPGRSYSLLLRISF